MNSSMIIRKKVSLLSYFTNTTKVILYLIAKIQYQLKFGVCNYFYVIFLMFKHILIKNRNRIFFIKSTFDHIKSRHHTFKFVV